MLKELEIPEIQAATGPVQAVQEQKHLFNQMTADLCTKKEKNILLFESQQFNVKHTEKDTFRSLYFRYASVYKEGKQAFFQIITPSDSIVGDPVILFTLATPGELSLMDLQVPDVEQFHDFLTRYPNEATIIRPVTEIENPYHSLLPRIITPKELRKASKDLLMNCSLFNIPESLLPGILPTKNAFRAYEKRTKFKPRKTFPTGHVLGKEKMIAYALTETDKRSLFTYQMKNAEGDMVNLITNFSLRKFLTPHDTTQNLEDLDIRIDSFCSCELGHDRIYDHSCGIELAGSIKYGLQQDKPFVIAQSLQAGMNRGEIILPAQSHPKYIDLPWQELLQTDFRSYDLQADSLLLIAALVQAKNVRIITSSDKKLAELQKGKIRLTTALTNSENYALQDWLPAYFATSPIITKNPVEVKTIFYPKREAYTRGEQEYRNKTLPNQYRNMIQLTHNHGFPA